MNESTFRSIGMCESHSIRDDECLPPRQHEDETDVDQGNSSERRNQRYSVSYTTNKRKGITFVRAVSPHQAESLARYFLKLSDQGDVNSLCCKQVPEQIE